MQGLIKRSKIALGISVTLSILTACASHPTGILEGGIKVEEIYKHGVDAVATKNDENKALVSRLRHDASTYRVAPDYSAWTRDSINEIRQLFPTHQNKRIAVYVYPHLSSVEQNPIPGYVTEFSLYIGTQYALPEEIPAEYPDDTYRRVLRTSVPDDYTPPDRPNGDEQ